ncbi:alpha/beta hydrolase [Undibacterium sp. TC4M20W]|uniref:alpha/beta hydrolase n=1 Tax=Undibacterium sp. TC4M20W TaxID=3413052 RepID=UPI003BF0F7B3
MKSHNTIIHHQQHDQDRAFMVDLRAALASAPKLELTPEARPGFDVLMSQVPLADAVDYETSSVARIPGAWCSPAGAQSDAAILYLHGGGYVLGSSAAYQNLAGQIAARAGVKAFVPDYRLAPEHRFPGALEDAIAAYKGLIALGYRRIALVGDSAGGGLALALLSRLQELAGTGLITPVCAAVMSPWTDLSLSGASMSTRAAHDPLLSREVLAEAAALYLGNQDVDTKDPLVSALFARHEGIAPVRLHVGADEVLMDDAIRYAQILSATGGTTEVHVWEGMTHVFPASLSTLIAAHEALDDIANFLRQHLT